MAEDLPISTRDTERVLDAVRQTLVSLSARMEGFIVDVKTDPDQEVPFIVADLSGRPDISVIKKGLASVLTDEYGGADMHEGFIEGFTLAALLLTPPIESE